MIIRKYILIFTLALISCAGTNYIHSLSEQKKNRNTELIEQTDIDVKIEIKAAESEGKVNATKAIQ